jgi:hypothetical protein
MYIIISSQIAHLLTSLLAKVTLQLVKVICRCKEMPLKAVFLKALLINQGLLTKLRPPMLQATLTHAKEISPASDRHYGMA